MHPTSWRTKIVADDSNVFPIRMSGIDRLRMLLQDYRSETHVIMETAADEIGRLREAQPVVDRLPEPVELPMQSAENCYFGTHRWTMWQPKFELSFFQTRRCLRCGLIRDKMR